MRVYPDIPKVAYTSLTPIKLLMNILPAVNDVMQPHNSNIIYRLDIKL